MSDVLQSSARPTRKFTPVSIYTNLATVLFVVAVVGVWHIYSLVMPEYLFPGPWPVLKRALTMWSAPQTAELALMTLFHVFGSVAIAFVIGTALAMLAHFFPIFHLAIYGRITGFLNSFSGIGWAFLGILWFGLSSYTVIFAVTAVLVPFAVINAGAGLKALDEEISEMSYSFARNPARRITLIILPLLLPYLFATLRVCISMAWKVTLTAELFAGRGGLGTLVNLARQRFDTEIIFSIVLLLILVVFSLDRFVLERIQNKLRNNYVV